MANKLTNSFFLFHTFRLTTNIACYWPCRVVAIIWMCCSNRQICKPVSSRTCNRSRPPALSIYQRRAASKLLMWSIYSHRAILPTKIWLASLQTCCIVSPILHIYSLSSPRYNRWAKYIYIYISSQRYYNHACTNIWLYIS